MTECGPQKSVRVCRATVVLVRVSGCGVKPHKAEFWTANTTEDDDAAKDDKDDKDDESACVIQCPWSGQPKIQQ